MLCNAARYCALVVLLQIAAAVVAHHAAWSTPLQTTFGIGTRSKAMGGAGSVLAEDFSAVYANPAGLSFCSRSQIALGYHHIASQLSVKTQQQLDAAPLQFGHYDRMHVGLCFPAPLRLSLGLFFESGFLQPARMRVQSQNPQPQFLLYDTTLTQPSMMGGLALRIVRSLSVGIGLGTAVSTHVNTSANVQVVPPNLEMVDLDGELSPSLLLVGGLTYQPAEGWRLALVYRTATFSSFNSEANVDIKAGTLQGIPVRLISKLKMAYAPMQLVAGALLSPLRVLRVAVELTWLRWSKHEGPFPKTIMEPELIGSQQPETIAFQDTFVPRMGMEYSWRDMLAIRGGYAYHMAVTKLPTQQTNVLDGNTHFFTTGAGYRPPRIKKVQLKLDAFGQVGYMPDTSVNKPTQPEPNQYTFGGVVWDTGLTVGVSY
ncbi:MAG: outer membrane protein transport protein [Myxococcota bacterium]